jgi:hypothetical protein
MAKIYLAIFVQLAMLEHSTFILTAAVNVIVSGSSVRMGSNK